MIRRANFEALEERCLLSSVAPLQASATDTSVNPVILWNAVALEAIRESKTAPPVAARDLAIVQVAVYDAVNAIDPRGPAYRVRANGGRASSPATVAAAAHETLKVLFPDQSALIDDAYNQAVAGLAPTRATAKGLVLGKRVADRELAARSNDGSNVKVNYTPIDQPGLWQPTPPTNAPAFLPGWGNLTPFVLKSGSQFRPPAPPALTSTEYASALNQVESLGARNSTTRTPDQTQIALFWSDGGGTETPPGHWNAIAEELATQRHDTIQKDARVFAVLNLALADAAIASWDAKYTYDFWRPITAIRQANTDNNPGTTADPSWTPLLTTPAFPSYVSGHSTFSAAAAAVLSSVYGARTQFTTTSDSLPGVTRSFASFTQAAQEAGVSRIYGGIHFAFDNENGLVLGHKIGQYVYSHALRGK